jgi:thiol:disulfide interchange protein DsbA
MKTLFGFLAALILSANVSAIELKEGVHYEVVNQQSSAKPEIKEFFSFYCPHCHTFEPLAKKLKEGEAEHGYTFKKSHVDFLRAAGPDIQEMLTRALVTAEKLNKPEVNDAIFDYIHKQRAVFTSEKDVRNLFLVNGVKADEFEKAFNSFSVKTAAVKMKKEQDELSRRRVLTGVPTFIVNGKYKLIAKPFYEGAKTYDDIFKRLQGAAIELSKMK